MKSEPPPFRIAKPCPKQWGDMSGDAKRRFCEHCQLHVHNLSAMSDQERGEFVAKTQGHACISYELRSDGSMVTPRKWPRLLAPLGRVQQVAAALLAACLPMVLSACTTRSRLGGSIALPNEAEAKSTDEKSSTLVGMMVFDPPKPPPARKKKP